MNLLIDSNIILDMVQRREPFSANSKEIIADCIKTKISSFCFYTLVMRHLLHPQEGFVCYPAFETG